MSHRLLLGSALLIAATLAHPISAAAAEDEGGFASRFSGIAQTDFTNAYYFRGILQERDGFIAQPWGELYFRLFESDTGPIRDVTIGGGVWASFHTQETAASERPRSLYETDWYPLISLSFPHGLSLTTIYYWYTSPNGAFQHTEELNFKLAWDDSETLGAFALSPWINLAIETHKTALGPRRGQGLQMGIAPTLFEIPIENYPVTVTAPVDLGISIDDYYENSSGKDRTFGYTSFGIGLSVPLAFVPEGAGAWSLGLTGKAIVLSDTLSKVNRGDHVSPIGTASVSVEF